MARGRPRETAALRLLASWVYFAVPHYCHTQIPLSPLLFIDGHSSRMKIEETGEGKRKKKREKERDEIFTLLSSLSALTSMSFIPFFFNEKNANCNRAAS